MEMKSIKKDSADWVEIDPSATPSPEYEAFVKRSIATGLAQVEAGQGIPAETVWEELGIE